MNKIAYIFTFMHILVSLGVSFKVRDDICKRVIAVAEHILLTKSTIRKTAELFGVSKSTVHVDISKRLLVLNASLFASIAEICKDNFEEKHIRGGNATKQKSLGKNLRSA
ncbi:MAG: sporulation transcriptional regulator SpoIIID [Clostridia bacterium]